MKNPFLCVLPLLFLAACSEQKPDTPNVQPSNQPSTNIEVTQVSAPQLALDPALLNDPKVGDIYWVNFTALKSHIGSPAKDPTDISYAGSIVTSIEGDSVILASPADGAIDLAGVTEQIDAGQISLSTASNDNYPIKLPRKDLPALAEQQIILGTKRP